MFAHAMAASLPASLDNDLDIQENKTENHSTGHSLNLIGPGLYAKPIPIGIYIGRFIRLVLSLVSGCKVCFTLSGLGQHPSPALGDAA